MAVTLSKWGNSLAVRLPAHIIEQANLTEGDSVEVSVTRKGRVIIEGVRKELDFGALYKQITPENQYEAVSTGVSRGNENVTW